VFLIPKVRKDKVTGEERPGEPRLIANNQAGNEFCKPLEYAIPNALSPMAFGITWMGKIDLHSGYLALPITQYHQRYQAFRAPNGEWLTWSKLPWGANTSPGIF